MIFFFISSENQTLTIITVTIIATICFPLGKPCVKKQGLHKTWHVAQKRNNRMIAKLQIINISST